MTGDTKRGLDDAFHDGFTRADLTACIVDDLPASGDQATLQTRKGSDIEPREITWLQRAWLPFGMIGLFAGYGGGGKSTTALHIAAAGSVGGTFPDGQPAPRFNTLYFAAEDSPEHTIVPRLQAMGADLDRIHIVDGIPQAGGDPGWVQLRNHAAAIERTIVALSIGLVIVDPVSSYIGDANSDRESDVRAAIMPLVKVAERTGAAVLLIRHVSKAGDGARAASRILGSTAWHDIPRVVWMLADAPDEHQPEPREDGTRDTRRVLGVVKSNLAAKPVARWCVQPVDGTLQWLSDPSPVTIDECFYAQSNRTDSGREIDEWLTDSLKGGSKTFLELKAEGRDGERQYSERAIRASLQRINAVKYQEPGKLHGGWRWRLPVTSPSRGGLESDEERQREGKRGQVTEPGNLTESFTLPHLPSLYHLHARQSDGQVTESPTATEPGPIVPNRSRHDPGNLPPTGTDGDYLETI